MIKRKQHKAARLIPFNLHNLDDFLIGEHREIDPFIEEQEYEDYWTDHVTKCLQGVWGHDYNEETLEGGYRWMPGNLFFYVNDCIIKMEGSESREVIKKPLLRDVEWYSFYALTVCDGFSGFKDDANYTCYEPIGKLQGKITNNQGKKEEELNPAELLEIKEIDHLLRKPNGQYKEYISAQEYLYRTHDSPLGEPHFHNELKNIIVLASRGVGKSFFVAGGVITYDFIFGSARTAEEFFSMKMPSTVVVGSALSTKSDELLDKFTPMYEHIRENIGGFKIGGQVSDNEDDVNSPLYQPFEGSLKVGKSLTNFTLDEGGKSRSGTGSKIIHVTYKTNVSAGVGYRARRMVLEEAGLLDKFTDVHNENEGSQKRGKKSGYTIYIGTGGDIEKIQGIREAFYKPKGYKCFGMPDIFTNKPGEIGLFVPSYYADNRFKDKLGNTDIEQSFAQQMYERKVAEEAGQKRLTGQIVSYPMVPSEMFLKSDGNIFPTGLIETRLTDLETGEWEKIANIGDLQFINKENTKVIWKPKSLSTSNVVRRYGDEKNMTDEELKSSIIIYEHPSDFRPELTHYDYLYLVTYDSIKDEDGGTSLASVIVWKFWDLKNQDKVQFNIVAEWTGRHIGTGGLEKDHDIAFKLAAYYSCPIFPEINLKDILRYGRMSNRWYFFLPKPQTVIDGMEIKQKKEYPVGLYISPGMKPDLEKYLNDALHVVIDREHMIHGDVEDYNEVKMVSRIPSMRFCEELLYYSRDGNFDMVSSAMLFGVAVRQKESQPEIDAKRVVEEEQNDSFLNFMTGGSNSKMVSSNPAFSY